MIVINNFLHRKQLADIIGRWFVDRPQPTDVLNLKELVNCNCYLAKYILGDVAGYLFNETHGPPVESFCATTKGQLKDFLVANPSYTNERITAMLQHYQKYPQDYYRETPFDGRVYYKPGPERQIYLGCTRRKRFRRIAEKASRKIIDLVFSRIKDEAETLARERAIRMGVEIQKLQTPMQQRIEEFEHAERRIIKRIRTGQFLSQMPPLDINDVFGLKVVCEDEDVHRLTSIIQKHPRMEIVEAELHSGSYNALNITLRYHIDKDVLLRQPPSGAAMKMLLARGLSAETVETRYRAFIQEAEDDLLLEVIAAGYQDILESEIGHSMHEEMVLEQRAKQEYRGSLARNIAALMEFMLALRRYPDERVDDIPVKLWIKYMPEYFDTVMKSTYGVAETLYLA
ncbi:MAG: hypothetical protein JW797_19165 [Bradymonadales bacterium]|nr:hypothetical protein [Bradymonadales bacterium]